MARNRQKITDRTEQTAENRQDGSDRREQTGRNRQDGTDRTEQTGRNRQNRTDRTEQTGENLQYRRYASGTNNNFHFLFVSAKEDGVPAAMVVERHPARPYCCSHSSWSPCCNGGGKTPRTYILLQPQQMESLLQWWRQSQYVLHVLTVGDGNTPWMSILLVVEGHPARQYCYW
jgi:hypothetical protein